MPTQFPATAMTSLHNTLSKLQKKCNVHKCTFLGLVIITCAYAAFTSVRLYQHNSISSLLSKRHARWVFFAAFCFILLAATMSAISVSHKVDCYSIRYAAACVVLIGLCVFINGTIVAKSDGFTADGSSGEVSCVQKTSGDSVKLVCTIGNAELEVDVIDSAPGGSPTTTASSNERVSQTTNSATQSFSPSANASVSAVASSSTTATTPTTKVHKITHPPKGTQFYGYWYSKYCAVGTPDRCPTNCVNGNADTAPGEVMNGLMTLEETIRLAQTVGQMNGGTENATASLGIGAPPSFNGRTWDDMLCPQSTDQVSAKKQYNIMNIGGWGGSGNKPKAIWTESDIPDKDDVIKICNFMYKNNYQGISFDMEGVSGDWSSDYGLAKKFNDMCGEIKRNGYMVWIVLPAFNVKKENGGPVKILNPDNITLVMLMCYGRGLDSKWGGDPSGKTMTSKSIIDTITGLNVPADQMMLAWSYADSHKKDFTNMISEVGNYATAGCFLWCKGNTQTWSYTHSEDGSCAS